MQDYRLVTVSENFLLPQCGILILSGISVDATDIDSIKMLYRLDMKNKCGKISQLVFERKICLIYLSNVFLGTSAFEMVIHSFYKYLKCLLGAR